LDWLFSRMKVSPIERRVVSGGKEQFRPAAQRVREDEWRTSKDEFFAEWNKRNLARG
jgi:hypothetical protein